MKVLTSESEMIKEIERILKKGNSVEIKKRKDDIIALEVERKIAFSVPGKRV